MTNDLISDMITRLKNANLINHRIVKIINTKTNANILKVLKKEGYIHEFFSEKKDEITVLLKYKGWWIKKPIFSTFKRVSKPGQRIFSSYKKFSKSLYNLKYNQGIAIISTSSGIMSHNKAITLKKGGEILCYIN